jgi:hypothetical protein
MRATSSTIIGNSIFSESLIFKTLEEMPVCGPVFQAYYSNKADSVYLSWNPSSDQTKVDAYWANCVKGQLQTFNLYLLDSKDFFKLIYRGLNNYYTMTGLNSSQEYTFRVELCNNVSCSASEILAKVKTLDPPPPKWLPNLVPKFQFINANKIKFDWSNYNSLNTKRLNLTFRLERSNISFAYPPTPMEAGVRFHGKNFYKFDAADYFPEGYPFFGIQMKMKTKLANANLYYAGSKLIQNEYASVQFIKSMPSIVANTQSNTQKCYTNLNPKLDGNTLYNDNVWHSLEVFI